MGLCGILVAVHIARWGAMDWQWTSTANRSGCPLPARLLGIGWNLASLRSAPSPAHPPTRLTDPHPHRLGLKDAFKKDLDIVSLRIWLRVHRDALALFVSGDDLDDIIATPPGQAHLASAQVARISEVLTSGRTLFGEVLDQIEAQHFGMELESVISELNSGGAVTAERVAATKDGVCVCAIVCGPTLGHPWCSILGGGGRGGVEEAFFWRASRSRRNHG